VKGKRRNQEKDTKCDFWNEAKKAKDFTK